MAFREELILEKEKLTNLILKLQRELETSPNGKLRVTKTSKKNNTYQYYQCLEKEKRNGKYIRKQDSALAAALAQKEYDQKLLYQAEALLQKLQNFEAEYRNEALNETYEALPTNIQALVNSYTPSDKEYIANWLSEEYTRKSFSEGTVEIYTERGERVRSKSEKMIADKLFYSQIPYKYERRIIIDGHEVYSDFTILNVRTRKEFIWEHFGLMDNDEYVEKAIFKTNQYIKAGVVPGKGLIQTFETRKNPLNTRVIEKCIMTYLV